MLEHIRVVIIIVDTNTECEHTKLAILFGLTEFLIINSTFSHNFFNYGWQNLSELTREK